MSGRVRVTFVIDLAELRRVRAIDEEELRAIERGDAVTLRGGARVELLRDDAERAEK